MVEDIKPYDAQGTDKGQQVQAMFDNIAPAYDFMNRAMTLGIDRLWRRRAVRMAAEHVAHIQQPRLLDVATGTADMAIDLARRSPGATVTGIDLSEGMIALGREKVARAALDQRVQLVQGDCLQLPFDDNTFDVVTVAYGVRNFANLAAGYAQMARVLRPGGLLCVVELATPASPIARPFYNLYTRHIIPAVGRLFSHDTRAYTYLPESIAACPQADDMCTLMTAAGLTDAKYRRLFPGVCIIYTAQKAAN